MNYLERRSRKADSSQKTTSLDYLTKYFLLHFGVNPKVEQHPTTSGTISFHVGQAWYPSSIFRAIPSYQQPPTPSVQEIPGAGGTC